jgi:uncharacterized protein
VTLANAILLFVAALIAGAINSVAGGGGFIAFPSLVFTGVNPIFANATNTVALWPGTLASAGAYRREFGDRDIRSQMTPLFFSSFFGAIVGAYLLLHTPERTFMRIVPWLLGGATLLFAFGARVSNYLRDRIEHHAEHHATRLTTIGVTALQLVLAVYIGYFGAGAGIVMLALFAIMGMENIHTMNAYKTLLATVANGVAMITFIVSGKIVWPQGILMTIAAGIGGYGGAWYAQKIDPKVVRYIVIAIGCCMTVYFALRRL